MANTIGTAYIQIEPSTKGISKSISSALDSEASSAGASAGGKLSSALGSAAKVGVAAIAGATAAVSAFGKASVDAGMTFDSSMSQVAATMGFSTEALADSTSEASKSFQQLRDFAQEMGSKTAFSASESADALNYMALAGYDAETSMKMLPNVLNLAAAGGIDLASASDMVTDAQSALGLSLEETSVMVDQMAKGSSKSNTSVAQLGEAFLTIGANAKSLSGGTQELSTALGILADNGIKGAEGGTHLRNIMLALNPTTDAAVNAWDKLGVSAYDAQGNLRPLEDTFGDLNKAMEGMSDQEKTDIIGKMFNKTDLASVNALLATSSDRWNELSSAIGDSKGAAEEMANVQLDNLSGDVTLFQSALEGAKIAVSDELTPSLREFVQFGSDGLSQLTEAMKKDGFGGAMEVLGDLIAQGLKMLVDKLPEVVQAGVQLLDALIDGLIQNLDAIIDATIKIITTIASGLIKELPKLADAAMQILMALGKYIIDNLDTIIPAVVDIIQQMMDTLVDNLDTLLDGAVQLITAIADGIVKYLPEMIPAIIEIVLNIVDTLLDHLEELIDVALELILAIAEGLIDALPELAERVPEIIVKIVETLTEHMPEIIETATEIIVQLAVGLIEALPELISKIPEIIMAIIEGLKEEYDLLKTAGGDIVSGIWDGISDNWDVLKRNIGDAAHDLVEGIKDFFRIGSPSKLMRDQIGQWIPKGIAVGIEANTDSVTDAMDEVAAETLGAGNNILSGNFSPSFSGQVVTNTEDTMGAILGMLQRYMPTYATNDKLSNLDFRVNDREFARLVNGVQ